MRKLEENKLISKTNEFGSSVEATAYGHIMARYYLSINTMQQFGKVYYPDIFALHNRTFNC